jgi:hypothetical protein
MAERCGNCLAPLMPDTCTHEFTCLYCDAEKMERRERISMEDRVTRRETGDVRSSEGRRLDEVG